MKESSSIEAWPPDHARWPELLEVVGSEQQTAWVTVSYAWHCSTQMRIALRGAASVGVLRFVTQVIGVDDELEPVRLTGDLLVEVKVLAFAVQPAACRQGIGRAHQEQALPLAAQLGCYQLRSHSSGANQAHHQLKLTMGFAIYPSQRGNDRSGAYFGMPLRGASQPLPCHDRAPPAT